MEYVDMVWAYIAPVWAWMMEGVDAFAPLTADGSINWVFLGIQMGVIALIMALMMPSYGAILIFTVASVIVHVIVDEVLPIVRDGAQFTMPPVTDMVYLQYLGFAAAAYLFGLTVLSILKAIVLPR